jgi:hypothetical protein
VFSPCNNAIGYNVYSRGYLVGFSKIPTRLRPISHFLTITIRDSQISKGAFRHGTVPRGTAEIEPGYFDEGIRTACGAVRCRSSMPMKSSRARLERHAAANLPQRAVRYRAVPYGV